MNEELAEFIGIFIGDGSLNIREEKCSYEFKLVGNIKDEKPYFEKHVSKLASRILGREIKTKLLDAGRSVGLYFCSKTLAHYLQNIGMHAGAKSATVEIPKIIMKDKKLRVPCIRGIFDTDGCFTLKKGKTYPVITFAMKSRKLIWQLEKILQDIGINYCSSFDIEYFDPRTNRIYSKHYLSINGRKNTQKWLALVGTNNPKNRKKFGNFFGVE